MRKLNKRHNHIHIYELITQFQVNDLPTEIIPISETSMELSTKFKANEKRVCGKKVEVASL